MLGLPFGSPGRRTILPCRTWFEQPGTMSAVIEFIFAPLAVEPVEFKVAHSCLVEGYFTSFSSLSTRNPHYRKTGCQPCRSSW
jgi:hypothetical protein